MGEKGIAQILVLLLVLGGIIGGVFLVQQKTNFIPKAISLNDIRLVFSGGGLDTTSHISTGTAPLFTPSPIPSGNSTPNIFVSAYQRLLMRKNQTSPTPTPKPIVPQSTIIPSPTTAPTITVSASPTPTTSSTNSTPASWSKPICSVFVNPANGGTAPIQVSVCVGNNSNPYQSISQELVDYDGNGTWDYSGASYGCHRYIFSDSGIFYPKAKTVGVSGIESDICQTSVVISSEATITTAPTPVSTFTPTPTPTIDPYPVTISNISSMNVYPGDRVIIYGNNFFPPNVDVTNLRIWLVDVDDGGVNELATVSPNTGDVSWGLNSIAFTIKSNIVPQSGLLKVLTGTSFANVPGTFTVLAR